MGMKKLDNLTFSDDSPKLTNCDHLIKKNEDNVDEEVEKSLQNHECETKFSSKSENGRNTYEMSGTQNKLFKGSIPNSPGQVTSSKDIYVESGNLSNSVPAKLENDSQFYD